MRFFMSLWPSHNGLPRWSYVIILVSLLSPELSLLVAFTAALIWLLFDGYRFIWVDCVCLCQDAFCTPLIIAATSQFCLGLTSFVVTERVVLVVFLLLLRRSFTACYLSGSFSIRCWLLQMSCYHSYFPYNLVGFLMSNPISLWFIFPFPCPPRPPRPPIPRPPLPSNRTPLPLIPPIPDDLTCCLCPYLPYDGWVAGKRRDITVDKYVEAVS